MKSVLMILLLIFTGGSSAHLLGQNLAGIWKKLPGPEGGVVSDILVRNDTLYCAGYGGVYQSTDHGAKWQFLCLAKLDYVYEMRQNKYYLFISSSRGAYRYDLKSAEIEKINYYGIYSFATLDSIVLMGADYGIYKSTDYGRTWTFIDDASRGHEINELIITGSGVTVASACGASGSQTLTSTDLGDSWTILDPDPIKYCIIRLIEVNSGVYAAADQPGDIYKSADGFHWQLIHGINAPKRYTSAFHYDGQALYLGTDENGVYKSKNFAMSWVVNSEGIINKHIRALNSDEQYDFVGTTDGFYRKLKNENTWQKSSTGLNNIKIYDLEEIEGKIFAATYGSGLLVSDDGGVSWHQREIDKDRNYVYDVARIGSRVFAIASRNYLYPFGAVLFVSDDMGETWHYKKFGSMLNMVAGNEHFIIVGSDFGLFRSDDLGNTWKKVTNGVPENINVSDLAVLDSVGLVVNGTGYVYRSVDFGKSWRVIRVPGLFSGTTVRAVNNTFYIGSSMVNEVFVSKDYGKTWQQISVPLSNSGVTDIEGQGKYVFISLYGEHGLIASSDSGKTWNWLEYGLNNPHVTCVLCAHNGIYVGTSAGIYRFAKVNMEKKLIAPQNGVTLYSNKVQISWHPNWGIEKYRIQVFKGRFGQKLILDQVVQDTTFSFQAKEFNRWYSFHLSTVSEFSSTYFTDLYSFFIAPPTRDMLDQNYPNPFNHSTTVRYHLSKESRVQFFLYDARGRKVKKLFDAEKTAGTHYFGIFDLNVASGVYYLKLKTDNAELVRKIVVLK